MPEGSRYALYGKARQPQNYNDRTLRMVDELEKLAKKI
jgi:hypothetical protein